MVSDPRWTKEDLHLYEPHGRLDLDAIREKWLRNCPNCDAMLPVYCTRHPGEDYRPVMLALVTELEHDRAFHAKTTAYLWRDPRTGEELRLDPRDVTIVVST